MIKSVYIKNFILIDELNLNLENGFTVITGETGAGKSILLNSVDVALGAKASKEIIKSGENSCLIEINFSLNSENPKLTKFLKENEIEQYKLNLQDILNFANIINKAPVEDIDESITGIDEINVFRKDEIKEFEDKEALLQNSKNVRNHMFQIPKVIN